MSEAPKHDQPPVTMGRIVFYVKTTGLVRSAHVSVVHDDGSVNLTVFDSDGSIYGVSRVRYHDYKTIKTNTWHWPPRA